MIDYRRKDYTPSEIVLEMVKDSEKTPYAISKAAELNKNEVGRWMNGTKGSYSGKIYHKSYINSSKNLDKYANMEVTDKPFYTDLRTRGSGSNHWCIPVIGIWMHDYDLCRKRGIKND